MTYRHFALAMIILVINLMITGCATTTVEIYQATGENTLCTNTDINLGYVAVLPEVAWRKDQKEAESRTQMALQEIQRSFKEIPCGNISSPGGIKAISDWSAVPESKLLEKFSREGVNTLILLRIEELTPRLFVTFSLPFLWAGTSEADFRVRILSVNSGKVLADMRVKQSTGGPFNIRPAKWARVELGDALDKIVRTPE